MEIEVHSGEPLSTAKLLRAVDVLEGRIRFDEIEPAWQADIDEYLTVIGQPRVKPEIDTLEDGDVLPAQEPAKPEEVTADDTTASTK